MANYKFVNADQLDSDLTQIGNAIRAKGGLTEPLAFPAEMVSAIEAISTGVELNFDVAAYATEEELVEAAPKENTIGVITTTEITGWIFDANQPEDLTEGMVWIITGTSIEVGFNALKKNGIQVYPKSAKQMIDGTLVDVPAMSYRDGEWVALDSNFYLFKDGNQFENITGGWFTKVVSSNSSINTSGSTIKFSYTNVSGGWQGCCTQNAIDLSDYSILNFDVLITENLGGNGGVPVFGVTRDIIKVTNTSSATGGSNTWTAKEEKTANNTRETISIDISGLTEGYVSMYGIMKADVYAIWLK